MRGPFRASTIGSMFIHPDIVLEIARQRQQELRASAERRRITTAASADRKTARGRRADRPSDSTRDASWLRSLLAAAAATRWR